MLSFIVITWEVAPKIESLVIIAMSDFVFKNVFDFKAFLPYYESLSVVFLPTTLTLI